MEENKGINKISSITKKAEKKSKRKSKIQTISSKVFKSESKNLREGINKLTQIMAAIVRKKMKIVDLIIAILVVANIAIGFTANNYFTGMDYKCYDKKTTDELKTIFNAEKLLVSIFYDCNSNCYRKNYTKEGEIDTKKGSTIPKIYPYYGIECASDCTLSEITKNEYTSDYKITALRWINCVIVILIICLLVYKYGLEVVVLKTFNCACDEDSIFTTGLWKYLLLEIIVMGVFSPPGYDKSITGKMLNGTFTYSVDSLIMLIYLLKLYYFLRVYWNFSLWTSEEVLQIGIKNKLSIGASFILKAQFKYSPYIFMFFALVLSIGLFGFLLRIFEYGYAAEEGFVYVGKAIQNPNFKDYSDTFWVIIITMMTIGYGDIYPSTHFGRVVVFFAALVGMILVSLLIVSMSNFVTFLPEEKKAHNVIKKIEASEKKRTFSAKLIVEIIRLVKIKKDQNNKGKKIYLFFEKLMKIKEISIQFNKFNKIAISQSIPSDELLSQLEKKLNIDSEILAPLVNDIKDINQLTKNIMKTEKEIYQAINYIKIQQDDVAEYLVKINNMNAATSLKSFVINE